MAYPKSLKPSSPLRWDVRDQMRLWYSQIKREGWAAKEIENFIDDVIYELRAQVAEPYFGEAAEAVLDQWELSTVDLPPAPLPAQVQAGRFIDE